MKMEGKPSSAAHKTTLEPNTNMSHDTSSMPVVSGVMMVETTSTSREVLENAVTLQALTKTTAHAIGGDAKIKSDTTMLPPLEKFTFFPMLPPELREQIWKAVPYRKRMIGARKRDDSHDIVYHMTNTYKGQKPAIDSIHTILHANHESREVALNLYVLVPTNKGFMYVSWETDHFHMDIGVNRWEFNGMRHHGKDTTKKIEFQKKCRNLAIMSFSSSDHDIQSIHASVEEFKALRKIKCLFWPPQESKLQKIYLLTFPVTDEDFYAKHPQINTKAGKEDFIKEWKEAMEVAQTDPRREILASYTDFSWSKWILDSPL